jgi:hypothetical protein
VFGEFAGDRDRSKLESRRVSRARSIGMAHLGLLLAGFRGKLSGFPSVSTYRLTLGQPKDKHAARRCVQLER